MRRTALAKRYARALVDMAGSLGDAARLAEELKRFHSAVSLSGDLRQVMQNPSFSAERRGVVESIADHLELGKAARRALLFLVERDRLGYLDDIVEAMRRLVEDRQGKLCAEVVSAFELPEDRYRRIRAALERITGRLIVLTKTVDPKLIGGIVTRVGSVVYDGSIQSQLANLKMSLGKES